MLRKYALGVIALGLIGMSSANAGLFGFGCGDWCDNYKQYATPTLHYQGGMVNKYDDGVMLSYQAPGHALLCGHYVGVDK
jgi:hypothetical protein